MLCYIICPGSVVVGSLLFTALHLSPASALVVDGGGGGGGGGGGTTGSDVVCANIANAYFQVITSQCQYVNAGPVST